MPNKVLVVDDNEDLALALDIRLRASGYRTLVVGDGPSAIKLALDEKPGAVILDLFLPGEGGLAVLQSFRSTPELCSTPVIIVTGDHSPRTRQRVLDAGAVGLLEKPIDYQLLLAILRDKGLHAGTPLESPDNNATEHAGAEVTKP